jgi:hypothetical protein
LKGQVKIAKKSDHALEETKQNWLQRFVVRA